MQYAKKMSDVMQSALHSEQAEVRQIALEVIPWDGTEAKDALADARTLAIYDPEPAVRRAAVEVLIRYDEADPATRVVLEAVAEEEKGSYGDFVRQEVDRIAEETAARSLPDFQVQGAAN